MPELKYVSVTYTAGGVRFSAQTTGSVHSDAAEIVLSREGDVLSVTVHAAREIVIESVEAVFTQRYDPKDRIFLNGYQSWTDSREHSIFGKMRGIDRIPRPIREKYRFSQYGDYNFHEYANRAGVLHGWSYGYIRRGSEYSLIASLAEETGFTKLVTDLSAETLTAQKDCRGLVLNSDWCALKLLLTRGTESEVFDRYFAALGTVLRPEAKPVFGYTSWYRHYQDISEEIIRTDLEGLLSQKYKADVFQIDDGWQTAVGDWLSVDAEKFPHGMQAAADQIRQAGMLPGLWLAPFVCEENSVIFREHADWLLRDEAGKPVSGGSNWSGFYALDIYNEAFRAHLKAVFDTVVRQWGYGLLKLDFLYAACLLPRKTKTRGAVMADGMALLRELAGDAFILGCGVPLASAFGKVDYCRIGCDVSLDWDDKPYMRLMHRERVSTKNTVLDSVFRRQLNGRAFLNDPDVFLLRSDRTGMTAEQKACLAEVNALCGSVLFTSDNAAEYTDAQRRVLDRIMRIRGAEILSASVSGSRLTLYVKYKGKTVRRCYTI